MIIANKYENIRVFRGDWWGRLQISADYSISRAADETGAICDVEEAPMTQSMALTARGGTRQDAGLTRK